jgi:glutamate racemase
MSVSRNNPIGIFDSGLGGLTVVKQIIKYLPKENIVYFGDTARVPYGTKSPKTIERFSVENALFLLRFNVKCIVVACNTSSSIALQLLKRSFKVPVIGVIEPGAREALSATRNGRIGVIGTKATIASGAYEKQIRRLAHCEYLEKKSSLKIISKECPLFVSLAEEGWLSGPVTRQIASIYLSIFKKNKVDSLVLGCTHYPLLKAVIGSVLGKAVRLVDSARQCAIEIEKVLYSEGLLNDNKRKGGLKFFVSDEPERFSVLGRRFLGSRISCIRRAEDV